MSDKNRLMTLKEIGELWRNSSFVSPELAELWRLKRERADQYDQDYETKIQDQYAKYLKEEYDIIPIDYKAEWQELYEHITKDMSPEQIEALSKRALNNND